MDSFIVGVALIVMNMVAYGIVKGYVPKLLTSLFPLLGEPIQVILWLGVLIVGLSDVILLFGLIK